MVESKERLRQMLVAARNLVEAGWCQYALRSGDKYCALGALRACADNPYHERYGLWHMEHIINDYLWNWNDAPGRTQAEVVDLFDRAIAGL